MVVWCASRRPNVLICEYALTEFRCSSDRMSSEEDDDGIDLRVLGHELQRARVAKGYSLTDLVSHTGIAKATLHRYEMAQTNHTIRHLVKIARALDVPLSRLVSVLDEPPQDQKRGG